MNNRKNGCPARRSRTPKGREWLRSKAAALAVCLASACGGATDVAEALWTCEVSLTLVPSTIGSMSSPSGSGMGTGTGATQDQALQQAYAAACSQLSLDAATASQCREGRDFSVEGGGSGNIRLFSAVERSVNCRS